MAVAMRFFRLLNWTCRSVRIKKAGPDQPAQNTTQCNLEVIAELEDEALDHQTATERASGGIVKLTGSLKFLIVRAILVTVSLSVRNSSAFGFLRKSLFKRIAPT
jgi:uncharacterized membrane protein